MLCDRKDCGRISFSTIVNYESLRRKPETCKDSFSLNQREKSVKASSKSSLNSSFMLYINDFYAFREERKIESSW